MNKQRGVSMSGFLMVIVVLAFAFFVGVKLIPAYMQNKEIQDIFKSIVQDSTMTTAPISEIRLSYNKRASIGNVTAIKADEIDINKAEGKLTLSANYSLKLPVFANASVLLEFNPSSEAK
jgi:Domain of unknown function (DUF4845)